MIIMAREPFVLELIANAKLEEIPIDRLKLDVGNVRLLHEPGKKDEEEAQKLILDDPKTYELCDQILAAKNVLEPLIVDTDNKVIEGNRRLVCLRILDKQASAGELEGVSKDQFKKVKCRVVPSTVNKKTVDLYLSTIHVGKKLPWKLFNRAKHLYRLMVVHGMTFNEIAENTGTSRAQISRSLKAYSLVMSYARRYPDDKKEWVHKFTYFDELLKRKDLKDLREEEGFLDKFAEWVHEGKFEDVRGVRELNAVWNDPAAKRAFENEDLKAARKVIERDRPEFTDPNFKLIRNIIDFLRSAPREDLDAIAASASKLKLLNSLEAEIKNLIIELEARRKATAKVVGAAS